MRETKEYRNYTAVVRMWWNKTVVFLTDNVFWSVGTEFSRKVAGSLFSRHFLLAAGICQLYLHVPSPTVQVCLFH